MKMSPIKSKIPSGKVTHVIDPSNIWIQLCTREFQELDDDIQESYVNVYPNTQPGMVQAEQFVIAYSNLAKKWLRACVSRVMDSDVDLFYLDYGYAEQRPVKQISTEFEPRFSELPAQALPCRLYGIEPLAPPVWISRASKILMNITSEKTFYVLFHSVSAGKHVVTLYDMKTQQNIIHQLLEAEVCKLDGDIPFSDSIHFDCNPDSWDFQPGSICWPYAYMDNGLLGQPAEDPIQQPATLQTHTSTPSEPVNLKTTPLRVPSTDMSIFELTSDLTPEKLVAFSQQQEYHRAQQEVKQIFAEHSAANDQPLHSPETSPGGFSSMKTMDEVLSNVHSQLQEMYNADKHLGNGNNSNSGSNTRTTSLHQTDTMKSSNKQSNRNQGMWTGKKCTVPPGFRPLGCNTRSEFSTEDVPRENYNSSNIAGKLSEDCYPQAQNLEPVDSRLLGPLNSVPVLATPSMFDTSDNHVCYPQEVESSGCHPHPPAGYTSLSSPPHNSVMLSFKRKLFQILPNNSNVDWSQLSWQLNNLFHDFDGRMLQAEKLEVVFEAVLQQAILNPPFLSTAIDLVFLLKDKDLFKESLAAVVKHLESSYVKVESKDAEFCAILLAQILVEIAKQNIGCSTCLSPFQYIIYKWLKSNHMTCTSPKDKVWQMMYQQCFVSFWSLVGGDCLLLMPQDFKEVLRGEIHVMILKSDISWSVRSRLLSVNTRQEQIVFYQERRKSCDVSTQTDAEKVQPISGNNSGCATPLPVTIATVSGSSSVGSHAHTCEANDDNIEVPDRWSPVSSPPPASPEASAECRFSNTASPLTTTVAASQESGSHYTSSFPLSLPPEPTDIGDEQSPLTLAVENNGSHCQTPELVSPSHFTASLPSNTVPDLEAQKPDSTETPSEFLWSKSINDFELKKPIVEPMSWNPFEPDFLERTLETAYVAPTKVAEEERPVTPPCVIPAPQPVQPVVTAPEMVRGSYAARVAEKAGENQNITSHRNTSMFDYRCEKLSTVRTVFSSRDNGNAKIRFVAKRLVPEPSLGNSQKRKGRKNGAFSNSSSSSNSSCTSSPSSKIWNQPRQGAGANISNIQGTSADLSLDQIGKMLQNSTPSEKDSWTAECKSAVPVAPILTDNNHNIDPSLETGNDRNVWSSRNRTHMETGQSSGGADAAPAPIVTSCRQEAPTIHCTLCGLEDHETHQCPDHSKSFFI